MVFERGIAYLAVKVGINKYLIVEKVSISLLTLKRINNFKKYCEESHEVWTWDTNLQSQPNCPV